MIRADSIQYENINGNPNVKRVKNLKEIIGYVHLDKGLWIFTPARGGTHTIGQTPTIAVGKSLCR